MERPRRALGLDVGERRIGVAIGDEMGMVASPLEMVPQGADAIEALLALVRRWDAGAVVVGLPTGMSGREGPQAVVTRQFAEVLRERLGTGVVLHYWDERLTSAIADRVLDDRQVRGKDRTAQRDAIAAAVILQGWLDSRRR